MAVEIYRRLGLFTASPIASLDRLRLEEPTKGIWKQQVPRNAAPDTAGYFRHDPSRTPGRHPRALGLSGLCLVVDGSGSRTRLFELLHTVPRLLMRQHRCQGVLESGHGAVRGPRTDTGRDSLRRLTMEQPRSRSGSLAPFARLPSTHAELIVAPSIKV